ncbi:MAG: GNAT family N-acetyltransferase [Lachnospiraceae bacterium]|nr:GNAT family N-acetyltransferase [Lachnospiraceae bacterium]
MKIALKEITEQNKQECFSLKVSPAQSEYIASNENSLNEAQENPEIARPFAIYADDKMIGFTMFAWDENNEDPEDKYWIWRFMIDKSLQGKGYGHLALKEIINYFKDNGADIITLSTKESNKTALSLYHQFGFKENGEMNDEEIVLKLFL